jgi:hypothetical protein
MDFLKSRDGVTRYNKEINGGAYAENMGFGQSTWSAGFSQVGSGLLSPDFNELYKAPTVTVSQSAGNLLVATGTTANAEWLAVSKKSWIGSFIARGKCILSQRIANQNFAYLLADLIGTNLPVTVNSATSITVSIPGSSFSSQNVGQFMNIGAIAGVNGVPGRYAIASVSGINVTFTVAGWPASGSGTCTLFGHNYYRNLYNGTTVTSTLFDAQRYGWASGDTTATINTTASPGHVWQINVDVRNAYFGDELVASAISSNVTSRASRIENLPDEDVNLYLFLWSFNGSTAPASTTTWTTSFVAVDSFQNIPIHIAGIRHLGTQAPIPAQITSSVIIASGTITTVSTVTAVTNAGTPAVPATPFFVNSAASTNGALIVTGTSGLQAFWASNIGASAAFVKLYNKATAPTVGTDVPEMIIPVPAAVGGVPGVAEVTPGFNGHRFLLGLGIAITGGAADSDTTAVAAGQVKVKLSRTV